MIIYGGNLASRNLVSCIVPPTMSLPPLSSSSSPPSFYASPSFAPHGFWCFVLRVPNDKKDEFVPNPLYLNLIIFSYVFFFFLLVHFLAQPAHVSECIAYIKSKTVLTTTRKVDCAKNCRPITLLMHIIHQISCYLLFP